MSRRLGRLPRKFNERIPLARKFLMHAQLPSPPLSLDYSAALAADLGSMLNDKLGDCTCAAFYHARQIWTAVAGGAMQTDADSDVLALYRGACGYDPGDWNTDQGGVEQDVLAYLLNTGAPTAKGNDKILGYVEVNQKNLDDLKRVIADCGVAYIGIEVPKSIMDNAGDNSIPWDGGGDSTIIGGHAVVLAGYDMDSFTCISWGKRYRLTNNFMSAHLDEAYGIFDSNWIEGTGYTPLGMTAEQLSDAMQALKEP